MHRNLFRCAPQVRWILTFGQRKSIEKIEVEQMDVDKSILQSIRFKTKRELKFEYLPALPESVEKQLFLEGRTPWTFKYSNEAIRKHKKRLRIDFDISAILKKEFGHYPKKSRYQFHIKSLFFHESKKVKIQEIIET